MISNYNYETHQWEKITLEQFLADAKKANDAVMLEITPASWKEMKPLLAKHGYVNGGNIDWKGRSTALVHFKPIT
jgi:hypothetical protein